MGRSMWVLAAVAAVVLGGPIAQASTTVVQNFESGTGDWVGTTQANSPLAPAGGTYYAIVNAGAYTYFDQGKSSIWTGPYTQSIDVYIDNAAGIVGDKWNFDMAIRNESAVYLDAAGIGAGKANDGWYIAATGNGGSYGNLGTGLKIGSSGWYTIGATWTADSNSLTRHAFVEPLGGVEIYSVNNTKTYEYYQHTPGGPGYGWFSQLTMADGLAVDNASLTTEATPLPSAAGMGLVALGAVALAGVLRKKLRTA